MTFKFEIDSLNMILKNRYKETSFKLTNISFNVENGYVLGLLGGNGMGKTSLIRCIVDNYRTYTGSITVDGNSYFKDIIGYIPDSFPFNDALTIKGVDQLMSKTIKTWDQPLFNKYLIRYKLEPSMTLKSLSLGQRQRLMVAVALSHHAKILILDEPTHGIDPFDRAIIFNDLREYHYHEKPLTIISSHDTNMLESFLDYVVYLEHGKVLCFEDIESLRDQGDRILASNGLSDEVVKLFQEDPSLTNFVTALQTRMEEGRQ